MPATLYPILGSVPLLVLLACAALMDLRHRRISNGLTLSILLTGLARALIDPSAEGLLWALTGAATGFALTFVLFGLGALGGGDVKLLTGVGAWLGVWGVLLVFAIEKVLGLSIVLAQAAWQGRLRTLFRNAAVVSVNLAHVCALGTDHVQATGRESRSVEKPLPYAVPVVLAVLIVLGMQ